MSSLCQDRSELGTYQSRTENADAHTAIPNLPIRPA
jgi:hypothetical protein